MMPTYDPKVLDELAVNLTDLLRKATTEGNYELVNKKPAPSYTSPKAFDGIKLQTIPGSGQFKSPEFVRHTGTTVKDVAEELLRVRIAQTLQRVGSLDLPTNLPPLPGDSVAPPSVTPKPGAGLGSRLLKGVRPSLVLDLLLTPLELNTGEDARLKQYKADDLRSSGGPR